MDIDEFITFEKVIIYIDVLLCTGLFTAFLYPFVICRSDSKRSGIIKGVTISVIYFLINVIGIELDMKRWICWILIAILIFISSHRLDLDRNGGLLFVILFFSARSSSEMILESVRVFLNRIYVNGIFDVNMLHRNTAIIYSITKLCSLILMGIFLFLLARKFTNKRQAIPAKDFYYLGIIPFAGILFVNVIYKLLMFMQGNQVIYIYDTSGWFVWLVPLIAILFYVGTHAAVSSYQEMLRMQEERRIFFIERQQVQALQERIDEVENFYSGIRKMRHELKNHLTNIKGLVENGHYEEIDEYVSRMDDSLGIFEISMKTNNPVIDVIVNDKYKVAEKEGIRFQANFHYPQSEHYNAYDIGIIVNNLLVNAIEACGQMEQEKKYIKLIGKQRRKFFLIEVSNSFEGDRHIDKRTGLPVSTKSSDKTFHGMGLLNVKSEAEKYMGDIKVAIDKNKFTVTVMLQERSKI